MREIIFDTETTGLNANKGDRVIEIGAIELVNKFPTGNFYHQYINSDGFPIHPDAERIHGISAEFLADKPVFAQIAEEFLEFFTDAKLVAHNATFDMNFLNAELRRLDKRPFSPDVVIDTLEIAKRKHPMGPNSLDALCRRYGIDNSHREKHGALLDSELLAEVYIELLGGKQASLELASNNEETAQKRNFQVGETTRTARRRPNSLPDRLNNEQLKAHEEFIDSFGGEAIWKKYNS